MRTLSRQFDRVDRRITSFMARYATDSLRFSLGVTFLWFGALKFFPGLSPAENLATATIERLTFGYIPPAVSIKGLALWETVIGIGLISGLYLRATLLLLFMQMLGTLTPLILFPNETFIRIPYAPPLEGQYIIKNLVLISGGLAVGATVRGGRIVTEGRTGSPNQPR